MLSPALLLGAREQDPLLQHLLAEHAPAPPKDGATRVSPAAASRGRAVPQLQDLPLHAAQGLQQPLVVLPALAQLGPQGADGALLHRQQPPGVVRSLLLFAERFLQTARYAFFLLNLICQ